MTIYEVYVITFHDWLVAFLGIQANLAVHLFVGKLTLKQHRPNTIKRVLLSITSSTAAIKCSLGMSQVGHVSSKIAVPCAYCKRDSSLADKRLSLCTEELLTYALFSSMVHKQVS